MDNCMIKQENTTSQPFESNMPTPWSGEITCEAMIVDIHFILVISSTTSSKEFDGANPISPSLTSCQYLTSFERKLANIPPHKAPIASS